LLDASASMGVPAVDRKHSFGVRLAAALAYVALNTNDPVRVAALRMGTSGAELDESRWLRHRGRYLTLKPLLSALAPAGGTALAEGISRYLERHRARGLAFVISDFLVAPDVYERALGLLRSRGLEAHAVQVIGREERGLERLHGRLRIRDAESGAIREVELTSADRRRYAGAFAERIDAIRSFCHKSGIGHALASSADGLTHCLTRVLPAARMLRLR
jgi:hypothetical protein